MIIFLFRDAKEINTWRHSSRVSTAVNHGNTKIVVIRFPRWKKIGKKYVSIHAASFESLCCLYVSLACVPCVRVRVYHAHTHPSSREHRSRCLDVLTTYSFDRIRHRSRWSRPYQRQNDGAALWCSNALALTESSGVTMRLKNPLCQHGSYE